MDCNNICIYIVGYGVSVCVYGIHAMIIKCKNECLQHKLYQYDQEA